MLPRFNSPFFYGTKKESSHPFGCRADTAAFFIFTIEERLARRTERLIDVWSPFLSHFVTLRDDIYETMHFLKILQGAKLSVQYELHVFANGKKQDQNCSNLWQL